MKLFNKTGFVISIISLFIVLILWFFGLIETWENKFYDFKFNLRGEIPHSKDIVIIKIDQESLDKFGRFPWRRSIIAKGISNMAKAGAKVIGTDIIFAEKSQNSYEDEQLVQAIKKANCVVGSLYFDKAVENKVDTIDGKTSLHEIASETMVPPIPALQKAYRALGFVDASPDSSDGILREGFTDKVYEGKIYYSFNRVITALFLNKAPEDIVVPEKMLANFAGERGTYTNYSFSFIYDGTFPREWIKNKIILIGSTAVGAYDHYTIPFCSLYPGVEFHATIMDNIINNNFIHPASIFFVLLLVLLFAIISGQVYFHLKPVTSFIVFMLSVLIYFFISQWLLFAVYNYHLDFVKPGLAAIFSYVGILGYRFRTEEKEKRWIKKTFSYYLSPEVIKELTTSPDKLKLGGEKKMLTVLFSDIRGFTSMSEKMHPDELVPYLNEYLSEMTDIVFKYSGTLDKFIGDAVMAFWGAPMPQDDHAAKAVNCAFEMMEKLNILNEHFNTQNKPPIDIGIGINTGEMTVGNFGSNQRMEYTVIGDNVNLASRLEGLNKQYSTHIIISESTYELVKDNIEAKSLGGVKVKGRERAVNIFEAIGRK